MIKYFTKIKYNLKSKYFQFTENGKYINIILKN